MNVPLLAELSERHPNSTVEIDFSDELADELGGRADVAVGFGPPADSPLTARRLGETGRPIWRRTTTAV